MEYRQLGTAGVRVSTLCLGTMNFGGPTDEAEAGRIIGAALDAGVNFFDTANIYQGGRSEEIVGPALASRRDEVVIATKVFNAVGQGPNDHGNSRWAIVREVERSLRRLGTDYIDLYQLHRFDETTPVEETLHALDDLVRQGKVRYLGVSTFPAWRVAQMQEVARREGLTPFVTEQPPYNLLERDVERELLPACRHYGMGLIPWSPLAAGMLSDRFVDGPPPQSRMGDNFELGHDRWRPVYDAIGGLAKLAVQAGTTLSRFAVAWVRDVEGVTAPIIGPRTLEQFEDALAAMDVALDDAVRTEVDSIVTPGESLWLRTATTDHLARH